MAPVEIMAGLIRIETNGDIKISGNVAIAGNLEVSGSTKVKDITAEQLIIASPQEEATPSGEIVNGEITTNSTVGKATIPANTPEITIRNPKINDYSLVYVTPTSSTQNHVLYVKEKGAGYFVVGFTEPIDTDTSFNWWIVEVSQ
jgi:hypothetical protein